MSSLGSGQVVEKLFGTIQGVHTTDPVYALTFDDGPHPNNTLEVLKVLANHGARATFFVIVSNAMPLLSLLGEVMDEGHEIALHGQQHLDLAAGSLRDIVTTVWMGKERLEQLTGRKVKFFRPPYGTQRRLTYAVARASGLEVVAWTSSPRDFLAIGLNRQASLALDELAPGGIMLLHDGEPSLPRRRGRLLERILSQAETDGWMSPVSVSGLLRSGKPIRGPWFQRRAQAMAAELDPFYLTEASEISQTDEDLR